MNLDALDELITNQEEIIRASAESNELNADNVWGVAQQVLGERGIDNLSEKQKYLYENAIRPLIENVPCEGWFDEYDGDHGSHYDCNNMIEKERLAECYRSGSMLCESCEEETTYRASRKAAFMRG